MNCYIETELPDWRDIFSLDRNFLKPFVFRGQQDHSWDLTSSLERQIREFYCIDHEKETTRFGVYTQEKWMIDAFQRKLHLYSGLRPKQDDLFEWLAIMQHYGCPTRLLDFTHSLFVAVYFALIESTEYAAVWSINSYHLYQKIIEKHSLQSEGKLLDKINEDCITLANRHIGVELYRNERIKAVIPLESKISSERLAKQQGLFLMATDSTNSFLDNLNTTLGLDSPKMEFVKFADLVTYSRQQQVASEISLVKINIAPELQLDILSYFKETNITAETLFPGLDGLAKSLFHTHIRTSAVDWQ